MAKFDIDFPDDFMENILLTDSDALCKEMLKEAAPILESSMQENVSVTLGDYATGDAVKSIKARTPKKAKNGAYIVNVCPSGYSFHTFSKGKQKARKYKVSNALKLIWKEYGIVGKQLPQPFLTRSVNDAREKVMQKMQEVYNKRVKG